MKFSIALVAAVAGIASAAPNSVYQREDDVHVIEKRQGGSTKNELTTGPCKKVTLIFARASTEPGNMGSSMGTAVCSGLKKAYNNDVACQGVGNPGGKGYSAGLADNVVTGPSTHIGTTQNAVKEARKMFDTAFEKCPQSVVVSGGYSQGTAVMNNTISQMPANLKAKVAGVVLFGYTRFGQAKKDSSSPEGQKLIHNFPDQKVMVLCSKSDGVCGGQLNVNAGHFSYMGDGSGPKAVAFLKERIDSFKSGGGGPPSAGSASSPSKAPKGKGMKGKGGAPPAAAAAEPPPAEAPAAEAPAAEAPAAEAPAAEAPPAEAPAAAPDATAD